MRTAIIVIMVLFFGAARGLAGEVIYVRPGGDGANDPVFENSESGSFPVGTPSDPDEITNGYNNNPIGGYGVADPDHVWNGTWPGGSGSYAHPTDSLFPWVYGEGNTVTVDGVRIPHSGYNGYVLGGLWQGPDHGANSNTVNIQNGAEVGKVYGGAAIGDARGNTVHVTGGSATQVTGGLSIQQEDGTGNQIGQQAPFYVVENNRVYLSGSGGNPEDVLVTGTVSGGWNASGDATAGGEVEAGDSDTIVRWNQVDVGDNVTIRGSTTNLYGGFNEGNSAIYENTVRITGGEITLNGVSGVRQIVGGYSSVIGTKDIAKVYGNRVLIEGGKIDASAGNNYSGIYGGRSQGGAVDVHDNEVLISGGEIAAKIVTGGSSGQDQNQQSQAFGNSVTITGGTVTGNVAGSRVNDAGTARESRVTLGGGTVIGNVYGAYDGTGSDQAAAITNNDVNLAGGRVEGSIYGGYEETGTSTGNTVNLYGGTVAENAAKDAGTGFVYGYKSTTGGGNTLYGMSGLTNVGGIDRFENAILRSGANVNVTGSKDSTGSEGFAATFNDLDNDGLLSFYNDSLDQDVGRINNDYSGNGQIGLEVKFNEGTEPTETDSVVFANAPASNVVFTFKPADGSEAAPYADNKPNSLFAKTEGGDLVYSTLEPGYGIYSYVFRENDVGGKKEYFVGLTAADTPDMGNIYTDGSATGLTQVALLADTFLRTGLERAVASICCPNRGFGISASIGYDTHRIGTGGDGHADLRGFSGQLALAYNRKGTPVNVGLFGEMFDGWYRTTDTVSLTNGVFDRNARGELESYGGGLFFQYRKYLAEAVEKGIAPAWIHGPHLEAVAHAGWSVMDFTTVGDGVPSRFDNKGAPYYGASLGGGYVVDAFPNILADVYGHGRWVRQGGRSAVDDLGQRIELDAADSLRLVAGVRAARRSDGIVTPYAGLAAEWEVLGKPGARIDGYAAKRADLSGVSGLIELGVGIRARDCVYVDLKAYGSVGKRRGIGGVLEVMYAF